MLSTDKEEDVKPIRLFMIAIVILAVFGGYQYFDKHRVEIEPNDTTQVVAITEEGIIKKTYPEIEMEWIKAERRVPAELLEAYYIYADYDEEAGMVKVSNGRDTLRYDLVYNSAMLNGVETDHVVPVMLNGEIWLAVEDIAALFDLKYDIDEAQKSVFIKSDRVNYTLGSLVEDALLYEEPGDTRILKKIKHDERIVVFNHDDTYKYVMTPDYQVGYVESTLVEKTEHIEAAVQDRPSKMEKTEPIYLTWEIYGRGYDTDKIGPLKGVNVISPTWYALSDAAGNFENKASDSYIQWAKKRGYAIWALVSNDFDIDRTHTFLHSASARTTFIENLLQEYLGRGYDGINIDFENVYKEDKRALTQFVAELSAAFKNAGLTVSMDVTVPGGSDTWSKCYDRKALGQLVDYLAIMTYDEHWASSPISGSVASYNWVRENMIKISEMVPSEKLLLGVPYYMRVWTEVPSETVANTMIVKSGVLNMPNAEIYIKEKNLNLIWDDKARQYYAAYFENGALKKVWFENAASIREKANLVNELGLGGIAVWRRGFETQDIWGVIDEAIAPK